MREELAKRVGLRGEFTATFKRRSAKHNRFGTVVTALFLDVRDEAGTPVTDHLWFVFGLQMERLKLNPGDRIRFMATVAPYDKAARDADEDWDTREWGPRPRVKDYKLSHPSNMRRVVSGQLSVVGEELPLFRADTEAS